MISTIMVLGFGYLIGIIAPTDITHWQWWVTVILGNTMFQVYPYVKANGL